MTEERDRLIGLAAEAQKRGDREAVRELAEQIAELAKPEHAVPKRRTEER